MKNPVSIEWWDGEGVHPGVDEQCERKALKPEDGSRRQNPVILSPRFPTLRAVREVPTVD